jgi:BASS family bile acid:Na+ symporter
VGLMVLAASPGGVSANLFSHLFGGNVAMNISLTAVNTVVCIVSLPLIVNAAIAGFAQSDQVVPLQVGKLMEVIGIVLLPVVLGMVVGGWRPGVAAAMARPMKLFSALVLAAVSLVAIVKEWDALVASSDSVGPAVLAFNLVSLLSGYALSRAAGLDRALAIAVAYEIGIHNSTVALFVALSVLQSFEIALPAAVYSVAMYFTAPLFGVWLLRGNRERAAATTSA